MKIDWKLKGWNLIKFGCSKDSIIHPETCATMVKMNHDNEKSLHDWITNDGTLTMENSLDAWLEEHYSETIVDIIVNNPTLLSTLKEALDALETTNE